MQRALVITMLLCVTIGSVEAASAAGPKLVGGSGHICGLDDLGAASCWGLNDSAQLGRGSVTPSSTHAAAPVTTATDFIDFATAGSTACGIAPSGEVGCWGLNTNGQLGVDPDDHESGPMSATAITVPGVTGAVKLWGGNTTGAYCAKRADGEVYCWGDNGDGQFGVGATDVGIAPAVHALNFDGAKVIAFAEATICAVMADASVRCAGSDAYNQLGNGDDAEASNSTALPVAGLGGVVDLAGSARAFCAVISDGSVKCWGDNLSAELGSDPTALPAAASPVTVAGIGGASSIGSARASFCATTTGGDARCWGSNSRGTAAGDATESDVFPPKVVASLAGAGGFSRSQTSALCGYFATGAVSCWGNSFNGEVGSYLAANPGDAFTFFPTVVAGVDLVQKLVPIVPPLPAGPQPPLASKVAGVGKAKADRRRRSFKLALRATISPPSVAPAPGSCSGTVGFVVTYSYKKTKRVGGRPKTVTLKKRVKARGTLSASGAVCVAAASVNLPVKLTNGQRVTLRGSFAGNGSITATAANGSVKLPKLKLKR